MIHFFGFGIRVILKYLFLLFLCFSVNTAPKHFTLRTVHNVMKELLHVSSVNRSLVSAAWLSYAPQLFFV